MAGKAGPDISEAGIQLYLDAKNEKSYSGNAVWKDLSGNANSGSMYTGKCLDFNGSSAYTNLGQSSTFNIGGDDFTISCWANPTAVSTGWTGFVYLGQVASSNGHIGFDTSNNLAGGTGDGSTWQTHQTSYTLTTSNWQHFVMKRESDRIYFYVDGEYDSDFAHAYTPLSLDENAWIGQGTGDEQFNGKISDVKIFNTALSADNISELYDNPNLVLPTGISGSQLVGYWPLSEGHGTIAHDGSGYQNHGTLSGSAIPTWVSGSTTIPQLGGKSYNTPMTFDGVDDYVDCDNNSSLNITESITVASWVYMVSSTEAYNSVVAKETPNAGYTLLLKSNNKIAWYFSGAGSDNIDGLGSAIQLGKWTHIAGTRDGSTIATYINGTIDYSKGTSGAWIQCTGSCFLGKSIYGSSRWFDGLINEAAIWNTALDPASISLLAATSSAGLPLPPNATTISGSNLVGYWRNDGDTTWTDRSSNNNTGSVNGSPDSIFLPEGIYADRDSQGFPIKEPNTGWITFNSGSGDYVKCGNDSSLDITSEITIEVWFKLNNQPTSGYPVIICKPDSDDWSAPYAEYALRIFTDSPNIGKLEFFMPVYGTTKTYSTTIPQQGQWYNAVATYDGTDSKIYVDGILETTNTVASSWGTSSMNLSIGSHGTSAPTEFFDGNISQPRIYNRALSQSEITQNYNAMKSRYA